MLSTVYTLLQVGIMTLLFSPTDAYLFTNGSALWTNHEVSIRGVKIRESIFRMEALSRHLDGEIGLITSELMACREGLLRMNDTIELQRKMMKEMGESLFALENPICFGRNRTDPKQCNGHGYCFREDECDCVSGWAGETCHEFLCFGKDSASNDQCSGHGICTNVDSCLCDIGWIGEMCEEAVCFNSFLVCSGHGECIAPDKCQCSFNWTGDECEHERLIWNKVLPDLSNSAFDRHSAVVYLDSMWVYGGSENAINPQNIWQFNFSSYSWASITPPGSIPDGRQAHSAVVYQDAMWIFGGRKEQVQVLDDFWCFNFTSLTWDEIPISLSQWPSPRRHHTAVVYKDSMWVVGGEGRDDQDQPFTFYELWEYDFSTESWGNVTYGHDYARSHSAIVYQDTMYIFGGKKISNIGPDVYENYLFFFNFTSAMWGEIDVSHRPNSRSSHSAVVHNDAMWVFGGNDGEEYFNKLWRFSFDHFTWEEISTSGQEPLGRFHHSAVVYEHAMWIFNGYGGSSYTNDFYHVYL